MSSKEKNIVNEQVLNEKELQEKENIDTTEMDISKLVVDPYKERIAQLEIELSKSQEAIRDSQLRAKAEVENLRRRSEQDIEKAYKFSLEKFANELLPVIDSLERALELADKTNPELTAMIEGIELTMKSMMNTIHKFGIYVINDINVPFNPDIHQAMSMIDIESEDVIPNQVIKVIQRGYTLNGRLLRPAMVAVANKKTNNN